MRQKPNILFIHLGESSFVKEDLHILNKFTHLSIFHFKPSNSAFKLVTNFFRQFFWLIRNIRKTDAIYCWFSDYHSFLPIVFAKLKKIPSITILGGYDCNRLEELNYGIFCSRWRAPLGKFVLKNSTLLLPVDKTLISTDNIPENWGEAYPNGVTHNLKNFSTNWKELPTGYDPAAWVPGSIIRKKSVCTVALCTNYRTALIKGWDLFIEVSKFLPEFDFKIVGASPDISIYLSEKYQPYNNLMFIPPQKRENLKEIFHQSSVYMQLSRAEGLPNVLCEAMMCGCVPVGSPVFGIPHAIGDAGFVAENPDPQKIAEFIKKAHENAEKLRPKARNRIIQHFSLQQREQQLKKIIKKMTV